MGSGKHLIGLLSLIFLQKENIWHFYANEMIYSHVTLNMKANFLIISVNLNKKDLLLKILEKRFHLCVLTVQCGLTYFEFVTLTYLSVQVYWSVVCDLDLPFCTGILVCVTLTYLSVQVYWSVVCDLDLPFCTGILVCGFLCCNNCICFICWGLILAEITTQFFFFFFLFLFNVRVNNFSVMLRRSHLFLGITSTFGE